jgi:hypothetical protein
MAVFPFIHDQVVTQFPWQESDLFYTAVSDVPCGKSFTRSYNERPLKAFVANFPSITKGEVQILENFFNLMRGRVGEFAFTDNAGATYTARFDQDEFEVNCLSANNYAVQLKIVVPA